MGRLDLTRPVPRIRSPLGEAWSGSWAVGPCNHGLTALVGSHNLRSPPSFEKSRTTPYPKVTQDSPYTQAPRSTVSAGPMTARTSARRLPFRKQPVRTNGSTGGSTVSGGVGAIVPAGPSVASPSAALVDRDGSDGDLIKTTRTSNTTNPTEKTRAAFMISPLVDDSRPLPHPSGAPRSGAPPDEALYRIFSWSRHSPPKLPLADRDRKKSRMGRASYCISLNTGKRRFAKGTGL